MSEAKAARGGDLRAPEDGKVEVQPARVAGEGAPWKPAVRRLVAPAERHAAITRTLYSYASYKLWADRVRDTWEPPASSAARDSKS